MKRRARWLRGVEIVLCIAGISLVGGALAETFARWNYQAQQERAFVERRPASVPSPAVAAPVEKPVEPEPKPAPEPAVMRLEIPRLGLEAIVDEGADEKTLARAVGRVPESARPGEVGNTVLAGHRDTFFRPLRKLRLNDRIRVVVPPHTYEYRVESLRVVEPEETSVLASNGVEELTLVTCYPFSFVGHAPERFIVKAGRVE